MKKEKDKEEVDDYDDEIGLKYNRAKTELTVSASIAAYAIKIPSIKLKVTASKKAWQNLHDFYSHNPASFKNEFYCQFIRPAFIELTVKKTTGLHKQQKPIVNMLKEDAGWLYAFLSYWCKQPFKEWPDYLKKFIEKLKKEKLNEVLLNRKGKYDAKTITSLLCEAKYGRAIKKHNLSPFDDPANFYLTYIKGSPLSAEVKKKYIDGKSQEIITYLVYSDRHLFDIFKRLKLVSLEDIILPESGLNRTPLPV